MMKYNRFNKLKKMSLNIRNHFTFIFNTSTAMSTWSKPLMLTRAFVTCYLRHSFPWGKDIYKTLITVCPTPVVCDW